MHRSGHVSNILFLLFGTWSFFGLIFDSRENSERHNKLEEASQDGEDIGSIFGAEIPEEKTRINFSHPITSKGLHKNLVEGDQDNELGNKGKTAGGGVDVVSLVELHLFLLEKLFVGPMFFLEGIELGFEKRHLFG